jgi:hypothetical protein
LARRGAGVAERYPASLSEMLLPDPEDAADLAARLQRWRRSSEGWKEAFAPFAAALSRRTWAAVAADFVALVEGEPARALATYDGAQTLIIEKV